MREREREREREIIAKIPFSGVIFANVRLNRAFSRNNYLKCGFSDPKNLYVKIKAYSENLSKTDLSGWFLLI